MDSFVDLKQLASEREKAVERNGIFGTALGRSLPMSPVMIVTTTGPVQTKNVGRETCCPATAPVFVVELVVLSFDFFGLNLDLNHPCAYCIQEHDDGLLN